MSRTGRPGVRRIAWVRFDLVFTKRRTPAEPGSRTDRDAASAARRAAEQAKGRPTPSRKEAEKARRDRLKHGTSSSARSSTRKGGSGGKAERSQRQRASVRERDALRSGDEANYPARDRGPVRKFCRDYIDSRRTVGELLIPLMVAVIALSFVRNATVLALTPVFTAACVVLLGGDLLRLRYGLRKELAKRFPSESTTGTTGYALMRASQMRFLRLPKARIKSGTKI